MLVGAADRRLWSARLSALDNRFQIDAATLAVGKLAFELRIVATIENLAELRARFDSEFDQVTAEHNRFRGAVLNR